MRLELTVAYCAEQAGLELTEIYLPAFASPVLGFTANATIPFSHFY